MVLWLLALVGWASEIYVNGTSVEPRSLAGMTLERATVRFDDKGNLHIEAPGYKVQVMAPAAGRPPVIAPVPASGITPGRWWIVTEDKASVGHTVEVWMNGQLVKTCRSGEGDRVFDLAPWLRPGTNKVVVKSVSSNPSGGTFTLFIGSGGSEKGYFDMPAPQVEFGLAPNRSGTSQREYVLTVDR
jgi:hypothetical protein